MTKAEEQRPGAPPHGQMAHDRRILLRGIFRRLSGRAVHPGRKTHQGVSRKALLEDLIENDQNEGTPSQREKRNARLLDRHLKKGKFIEKPTRGIYTVRTYPPWVTALVDQHYDELRPALEKWSDFSDWVGGTLDKEMTPQARELYDSLRTHLKALLEFLNAVPTRTKIPPPSSLSPKALWSFKMRIRRVARRMWKTRSLLKRELSKKGVEGRVSARVLEKFFSEVTEEVLYLLEPLIPDEAERTRVREALHSEKGSLFAKSDITKHMAEMPFEDVAYALGGVLDDIIDMMDDIYDSATPHTFKSHRDPRLSLPGWKFLGGLVNKLMGNGGSR